MSFHTWQHPYPGDVYMGYSSGPWLCSTRSGLLPLDEYIPWRQARPPGHGGNRRCKRARVRRA